MKKITSREYKIVVAASRYGAGEASLADLALSFSRELEKVILPFSRLSGAFDKIAAQREIIFLDTKEFLLRNNGYLLRKRTDPVSNKAEFTLKFRHPDRVIAVHRDMSFCRKNASMKLEEDIKPDFEVLTSFSCTGPVGGKDRTDKVKDLIRLYPGLAGELPKGELKDGIAVVNDLAMKEIVVTGAHLLLSEKNDVWAECALIAWFDTSRQQTPLIVEFSFRYGRIKEKMERTVASQAYAIYLAIQQQMTSWTDRNGGTKTALIFAG